MANSSAKKQYKANRQRLTSLAAAIGITNLLFAVIRGGLFRSSFDRFYTVTTIILSSIYALTYYFLWTAARPTFSETGTIIDAGTDITKGGILEYVHDIIYISIFVQLCLIVTKWALLIFLTIPVYIAYMWFGSGFSPFGSNTDYDMSDEQVAQMAGMSRKEKRKAERQTRKQK